MWQSHSPQPLRRTSALMAVVCVASWFSFAPLCADEPLAVTDAQVLLIQNTTIAAPIAGLVCSVEVREGQRVVAHDVLMRMDDRRAQAELAATQAAFQASQIQAENDVNTRYAQRTLDVRERELEQSNEANERFAGSVTATEIDRLQLVIDQAQLSVEQSEQEREVAAATAAEKQAAIELARLRISEHCVETVVAGQVAEVLVQVGQWVEPGTPLVRLISLDPIRVSGFIDGQRYDSRLVGRRVTFEIKPAAIIPMAGNSTADKSAKPDPQTHEDEFEQGNDESSEFTGEVTFVSDELNPVTSQVRFWAEIANPHGLAHPGMRGTLTIAE